jgi:hypothetical protein
LTNSDYSKENFIGKKKSTSKILKWEKLRF